MEIIIIMFLLGLMATFLGTLAGSGGLITFPAMLVLGVPVHGTITANKLSNTVASTTSLAALVKKRRIRWRDLWRIGPIGLAGGIAGGLITASIPEDAMRLIAMILLVFVFILSFLKPRGSAETENEDLSKKGLFGLFFGVGAYNGMFGPGQGSILMQILSTKGVEYLKLIGLTRINTLTSSLGALVTYLISGFMVWHIALPLTIGAVIGGQIAILVAPKLSKKVVAMLLRAITFLLIVQLLIETLMKFS